MDEDDGGEDGGPARPEGAATRFDVRQEATRRARGPALRTTSIRRSPRPR